MGLFIWDVLQPSRGEMLLWVTLQRGRRSGFLLLACYLMMQKRKNKEPDKDRRRSWPSSKAKSLSASKYISESFHAAVPSGTHCFSALLQKKAECFASPSSGSSQHHGNSSTVTVSIGTLQPHGFQHKMQAPFARLCAFAPGNSVGPVGRWVRGAKGFLGIEQSMQEM